MLRSALAPTIENATGIYLPADSVLQPGMGKAVDVVLAEAVAGALGGMKSMRLLHYILGTSLHFTLLRYICIQVMGPIYLPNSHNKVLRVSMEGNLILNKQQGDCAYLKCIQQNY